MLIPRLMLCLLAASSLSPVPLKAAASVPFKGHWSGITVSADLANFPLVAILSEGDGQLTHLGRYTMASPHTTDVFTGETIGEQIFTAANGDSVTAHCEGFPVPQADGTVVGALDCTFTSGTGRFEGVSGDYEFFLVATPQPGVFPPIYETEARITGQIDF